MEDKQSKWWSVPAAYLPAMLIFATGYATVLQHFYYSFFGIPIHALATTADIISMTFRLGALVFGLFAVWTASFFAGRYIEVSDRGVSATVIRFERILFLVVFATSYILTWSLGRIVTLAWIIFTTAFVGSRLGFLLGQEAAAGWDFRNKERLFTVAGFTSAGAVFIPALIIFVEGMSTLAGHTPHSFMIGTQYTPCIKANSKDFCENRNPCLRFIGENTGYVFFWDRSTESSHIIPRDEIGAYEYVKRDPKNIATCES